MSIHTARQGTALHLDLTSCSCCWFLATSTKQAPAAAYPAETTCAKPWHSLLKYTANSEQPTLHTWPIPRLAPVTKTHFPLSPLHCPAKERSFPVLKNNCETLGLLRYCNDKQLRTTASRHVGDDRTERADRAKKQLFGQSRHRLGKGVAIGASTEVLRFGVEDVPGDTPFLYFV